MIRVSGPRGSGMFDLDALLAFYGSQTGQQNQELIGYTEPYMGRPDIDPNRMIRGGIPLAYREDVELRL